VRTSRSLPSSRPAVSVTVVAYNSDRGLPECLRSLQAAVRDGLAEVIVVNNGSPDQCGRIVEEEFPEVVGVKSEVNRGFAGGCNLAWPVVRGRYWLLLNPDVVVPSRGLEQLVQWMDDEPELGAGSPRLLDQMGRQQSVGRRFPSIPRTTAEMLRLHLLLSRARRAEVFLGSYWGGVGDHRDVDWVPGSAMIIRREVVEAVGLLSEKHHVYGEDIEWCWRIRKAGWRIGVCGSVYFRHDEGQSTLRTWGETERKMRMWRGMYMACTQMRGSAYCRVLVMANTLAFAVECHNPRRTAEERARARSDLRVHMILLRARKLAEVRGEPEPSAVR